MKKNILHIGRHKSGTSALQNFLSSNTQTLKDMGYFYPESGRLKKQNAHHGIAHYLEARHKSRGTENQQFSNKDFELFVKDINSTEDVVIISSEAFSRINPTTITDVFDPSTTSVIIYLRESVDYLLSSYSQAIHNQTITYNLVDFEKYAFKIDYNRFIQNWAKVFGKENIKVKLFSSRDLKNKNIIDDFMELLGVQDIETVGLVKQSNYVNVSIGGNLLEFKRMVNGLDFSAQYLHRKLYRQLSNLASLHEKYRKKPIISQELQSYVRNKHESSNLSVFQDYFGSKENLFHERDFSSNTSKSITNDLIEQSEDFLYIFTWLSKQDPVFFSELISRSKDKLIKDEK